MLLLWNEKLINSNLTLCDELWGIVFSLTKITQFLAVNITCSDEVKEGGGGACVYTTNSPCGENSKRCALLHLIILVGNTPVHLAHCPLY